MSEENPNHIYRFRSAEALLKRGFNELENQEIYFAPPEQLNDPMECVGNIYFEAQSEIIWKKFIFNYAECFLKFFNENYFDQSKKVKLNDLLGNLNEDEGMELIFSIYTIGEIHNYAMKHILYLIQYRVLDIILALLNMRSPRFIIANIRQAFRDINLTIINIKSESCIDIESIFLDEQIMQEDAKNNDFWYKVHTYFLSYMQKLNQEKFLASKPRVACFQKSAEKASMWGYYANSHKGACLIFDFQGNNENSIDQQIPVLEKIKYGDILRVNYFEEDETIIRQSYLRKAHDWDKENEYRMISFEDDEFKLKENNFKLEYNFSNLVGIIFGINMTFEDKKEIYQVICKICKEKGRDIKKFEFKQAYFDMKSSLIETCSLELCHSIEEGKKEVLIQRIIYDVLSNMDS